MTGLVAKVQAVDQVVLVVLVVLVVGRVGAERDNSEGALLSVCPTLQRSAF